MKPLFEVGFGGIQGFVGRTVAKIDLPKSALDGIEITFTDGSVLSVEVETYEVWTGEDDCTTTKEIYYNSSEKFEEEV